jgi:glycosyltransferase involved in cell wall biosynthesis
MHVLFLVSSFPSPDNLNNGAHNFRSIKRTTLALNDTLVIHLRSYNFRRKIIENYTIQGVEVVAFSFFYLPFAPLIIRLLFLEIYKRFFYLFFKGKINKKFRIIHSAGMSFSGVIASYISKRLGISHLGQCMGSDVNIDLPKMKFYLRLVKFSKYCKLLTCNSEALAKIVSQAFEKNKVTIIYRGVDLNQFCFHSQFIEDSITFVYFGGLVDTAINIGVKMNNKGGVTLLYAWQRLHEMMVEGNIKMKINLIFAGPEVSEKRVESIIGSSAHSWQIKVVGQLDSSRVLEYLRLSSVVIIPSLAEGLPNIAMEAGAVGRAVVGTEVGGMPEIVKQGKTGFLVCPENTINLAECLLKYIVEPDLIISHGKNARSHIEENFDANTYVENYLNLYKLTSQS